MTKVNWHILFFCGGGGIT